MVNSNKNKLKKRFWCVFDFSNKVVHAKKPSNKFSWFDKRCFLCPSQQNVIG